MIAEPEEAQQSSEEEARGGPLVPFYGVPIAGIQAFRRGDIILYSVRGEPEQVAELMGQLGKEGVSEVVALISHQAQPPPEDRGPPEAEEGT